MPTLTVVVTIQGVAGEANVQLQRPNKPAKIGDRQRTVGGRATLTVTKPGKWQVAIAEDGVSSTQSPVFTLAGADVNETATLIAVTVAADSFSVNKDPEVDLAFIHDVLQATSEIFLRCTACHDPRTEWTQTEVDNLRKAVRDVIFTQLTRDLATEPYSPARRRVCDTAFGTTESPSTDQNSKVDLAEEDVEPITAFGPIDLLTCTQCRNYYYTTTSPYYMNYTWYMNCMSTCTP